MSMTSIDWRNERTGICNYCGNAHVYDLRDNQLRQENCAECCERPCVTCGDEIAAIKGTQCSVCWDADNAARIALQDLAEAHERSLRGGK